jgi:hypothetical protein
MSDTDKEDSPRPVRRPHPAEQHIECPHAIFTCYQIFAWKKINIDFIASFEMLKVFITDEEIGILAQKLSSILIVSSARTKLCHIIPVLAQDSFYQRK